jgi:hypothetical protein
MFVRTVSKTSCLEKSRSKLGVINKRSICARSVVVVKFYSELVDCEEETSPASVCVEIQVGDSKKCNMKTRVRGTVKSGELVIPSSVGSDQCRNEL